MSKDIKTSTIMIIAGGALLVISPFLDWIDTSRTSLSGWSTDAFGLSGIIIAAIGVTVAGGTIASNFAGVSLPDEVVGFSRDQVYCVLGVSAFLMTFGLQFGDSSGVGILIAWIAAAVVVAGTYLDMQASGAGAAPAAPPSQF